MDEYEIDEIISEIEKEWYSNGFTGDVRDDHALVYEVVTRAIEANKTSEQYIEHVAEEKSQRDWSDFRLKEVYRKAFIDGAKYFNV